MIYLFPKPCNRQDRRDSSHTAKEGWKPINPLFIFIANLPRPLCANTKGATTVTTVRKTTKTVAFEHRFVLYLRWTPWQNTVYTAICKQWNVMSIAVGLNFYGMSFVISHFSSKHLILSLHKRKEIPVFRIQHNFLLHLKYIWRKPSSPHPMLYFRLALERHHVGNIYVRVFLNLHLTSFHPVIPEPWGDEGGMACMTPQRSRTHTHKFSVMDP